MPLRPKILSPFLPKGISGIPWTRQYGDCLLLIALGLCAAIAGAISLFIVFFLLKESIPLLQDIGIHRFVGDQSWTPSQQQYNLVPMIVGSLLAMVGAVAIAAPLGVLSAIFCQYYAPGAIASLYRRLIELLAGIPSVVYGFWGLVVLVPMIGRIHPPGPSLLAGILILAMMILPTVALTADASLATLPQSHSFGAYSLGLSRWTSLLHILLPAAKGGILTGLMLATGRAIGETMAILMVCGNVVQVPDSLFTPMRTLTANIALEMAYATGDHRSALFVSGLFLMVVVGGVVGIAEVFKGAECSSGG